MNEVSYVVPLRDKWYHYKLKIKIGDPFKTRFRIAIEELPNLFKRLELKCLMA